MMKPTPVLLVHGIDDTRARFNRMVAGLIERGFEQVSAMNIQPPDASISIEAMGNQIAGAVRELQQTTQAKKVDIVAYSMGALAARYFLQRQGGRSLVRRFVSIAGPHRGTLMAYFRRSVGCCQMRPGSALICDLNDEKEPWGDVEVFSFWSPFDLMIVPSSSSLLAGANNCAFAVPLHHWMVSNRDVIDAVSQTLMKS